ncbi:tripartite tricarboxylate transporter TctB family protein [Ancylobacter mangrovi]|uniref:Tripartite tricarboxylate transporter TctB family protein n=1 Tax=Ancylobacter mangrovi TaxID=2972472 RepID=A0A9X2T788_9HYPH|nr:tripartite tricarboxylate transporter TctB family protein [Ancylobacter mangrovi]MCS0497259.1 tripartite tricarboxylate transporter TctB family protein [Ancylobacter mangrovi]MCS0505084.1 tripartite tricarboxylate transporter TctB family protein [Ancylobacter mangrovi]
MSAKSVAGSPRTVAYGDWIITFGLIAIMAGAYTLSLKWPANAAFFPRLLSAVGLILCLLNLGALIWQTLSPAPAAVPARAGGGHGSDDVQLVEGDEDQGNEDEFHKIFTRADKRMWGSVVSWIVFFFVGLYTVGLLVTLPVFTVLYLRIVAKASWLVCLLYVLGTAGLIYLLFDLLLHLPLPEGVFPILGS